MRQLPLWLKLGCVVSVILAALFVGNAARIWAKAHLANLLLAHAFEQSQQTQTWVKAWPWADSYPVARLRVPGLEISQIVMQGSHGEALAFGPGLMQEGAQPGESGAVMIAGHRDTHFSYLPQLRVDMVVELESRLGQVRRYRVIGSKVIDSRKGPLVTDGADRLLLISCYPFSQFAQRGPLRYLVYAEPEPELNAMAWPFSREAGQQI